MKRSNPLKPQISPKRRLAPRPPSIPKPKKSHALKNNDLKIDFKGDLKDELKDELKHIVPLAQSEHSVQFDQMGIEQLASSDKIALNVDQNSPSRRRSTFIEIAADAVQSVVAYINRPYTPSPEVLAFLESLYLSEEEMKEISTQELDQLINQSLNPK